MRLLASALSLFLVLGACGGGGGATAPAEPAGPDPQLVTTILGSCGADDVGQALDLQALLLDLFGGGAAAPDFAITGTSILNASFSWSLDLDDDQQSDFIGTTQFKDAGGNPTIPISSVQDLLDALAGDLTALGQLLQQAPAGTQIVTTYGGSPAQLPSTSITGGVTVVLGAAGTISTSSGSYASQTGTACTAALEWTDLDVSTVSTGGRPTGVVDVAASSPANSLDGTLTLDGDDTTVLDISVDGAAPVTYTLDLATGQVS